MAPTNFIEVKLKKESSKKEKEATGLLITVV
jgi:hypothetical protein